MLDAPELVQNFSDKGTGILLGGITNATVTNNFVTNNLGKGIVIGGIGYQHFDPSWGLPGVAFDPVNNVINSNDISGNVGFALYNYTANSINATCNWWGTNTVSGVVAKIYLPATVTYNPWLSDGTDDPTPPLPGFQPLPGACDGMVDVFVNHDTYDGDDTYTTAAGSDVTGTGTSSAPYRNIYYAVGKAMVGANIYIDAGTFRSRCRSGRR